MYGKTLGNGYAITAVVGKKSVMEATKNRIRPIFMSTLTSLFGLTPLVVFPGAGSELYRGIGTLVLEVWQCQHY